MSLSEDESALLVGLIRDGFKGIHERLDVLNGRTRKTEVGLAVLRQKLADTRGTSRTAVGLSSGIGAIVAAVLKFAWDTFSK